MDAVIGVNRGREAGAAPGPALAPAGKPAGFVARMTAPLLAAMAGHYQDRYDRDGAAPEVHKGLLGVLSELPGNIAEFLHKAWNDLFGMTGGGLSTWLTTKNVSLREFGETLWASTHSLFQAGKADLGKLWKALKGLLLAAWQKAKAAVAWVGEKMRSFGLWVVAAVAKAFSIFQRSAAEEAKRREEEAAYEKKYQEKKAAEKRDDDKRDEARRNEESLQTRSAQGRRQAAADAAAVAALSADQVKAQAPGAEKYQIVDNASLERRRMRKLLTGTLPAL